MADNIKKFRLKISQESKSLMDAAKKDGNIKKLTVKIEATHSGIINHNKWFYTPAGMSDGAPSFTSPYSKPVLLNHDQQLTPLGRVLKSEYEGYSVADDAGLEDTIDTASYYKKVKDFTKSEMFSADGYKGLGHIMLTVDVTDKDAIDKLLDGRYLTVSISGDTEQAVCSICGQDGKNLKDEEDRCSHWRGDMYDGEEAFLIAGSMSFKEVSFVNTPADENAQVNSISDSLNLSDDIDVQELEILDFVIDNTGDTQLKRKLSELLADLGLQGLLNDALKELGLDDNIQSDEDLAKLRKTSFLFSDARAFPINDEKSLVAAYKIFETIEDSKDKTDAMTLMDKKFKKLFGGLSLDDAIKKLQNPEADDVTDKDDTTSIQAFELDYDILSDKVVEKLKGIFDLDDSFLSKRNESLEDELSLLEAENTQLSDSLRSNIVAQILDKEDRISDEGYRTTLEKRTLESLQDKLSDLMGVSDADTDADADASSDDDSDVSDNADDITDPNADVSDAVDNEGTTEGDDITDKDDDADVETLSVKEIRDEYAKLIKNEGMRAASKYLADLRDAKKVPANFTFLR